MLDAVNADQQVRAVWTGWIEEFETRSAARITADRADGIARSGANPIALAQVLVGAMFTAMERDVRLIHSGHKPSPHLVATLIEVWQRAVYHG
jgi:hypothetical protein